MHSLLLSDQGELYSFGNAKEGQLGHGDNTYQNLPKLVEFFREMPIIKIAAGGWHSLVLTKDNKLYGFGYNKYCQLGRCSAEDDRTIPLHIELLDNTNIVEMAAGNFHSIVRTQDNENYSFGQGLYGKLGHGKDKDSLPKLLIISP